MTYDDFVGLVQARARLGTTGDTVRAIRATLQVLGRRLSGGEPDDLAAQLPMEIGEYLRRGGQGERFDLREFYELVSLEEGVDLPVSAHHARAVLSVLLDAVSPGEIHDVLAQLPAEYRSLFELLKAEGAKMAA